MASARAKNKLLGYLLFLPSGVILIAIVLCPLIWALITSFTTYTFVFPVWDTFVWFDNFLEALRDQYFLNSLYVICKFVVCVVFLEFFLGFVIAFLLSRDIKFKVVFYTILAIPMVLWYLQTGKPLVYSYGEEFFDFCQPRIGRLLFSYQKGWFLILQWHFLVFGD